MKRIRNLAIFNGLSLLLHISTSWLSQVKVLSSKNVGEISDKYPSIFTPAGITFLIWSVIYAALFAFTIYHIRMAFKYDTIHPANQDLNRIGPLFIINNLATTAWLIIWIHEWLLASVLLILVQLVTLIIIHIRLHIHDAHRSMASKTFTQFPLSIYLGWITIATIANISTWLTASNWTGWGVSPVNWAITMIAIAVLITVGIINRKRNVFFGLVVIWALYGILLKRITIDADEYEPVIKVIVAGIIIVGLACLFGLTRNLRRR